MLFAGETGTGKTMAAEVLAADLGLDIDEVMTALGAVDAKQLAAAGAAVGPDPELARAEAQLRAGLAALL